MKSGNHGTGGRVYKRYKKKENIPDKMKSQSDNNKNIGNLTNKNEKKGNTKVPIVIIIIFVGIWGLCEYNTKLKQEGLNDIYNTVISVSSSNTNNLDWNSLEGRLVHFSGVNIIPNEILQDYDFGLDFPNAVKVKRIVEYCQWMEVVNENEKLISKDVDECYGNTIPECRDRALNCVNHPSRESCNNDNCCSWKEGDKHYEIETSFDYFLDWRSDLINSAFFEHKVAYDNPQRSPFDSYINKISTARIEVVNKYTNQLLGTVQISSNHINNIPSQHYQRATFENHHTNMIGQSALMNGFYSITPNWYYSHIQNQANPVTAYYVDGVVTGFEGKCTPGDIRVGFEYSYFYPEISFIGQLNNGYLVPYHDANYGTVFIFKNGHYSVENILDSEESSISTLIWIIRIICLVVIIISALSIFK
eukprot:TRINITY_DN8615_c0_g1_i1.p1 TRINITY_DN8615_c0_g1~~TRINITY_DN8615_c0_g1_i1.p1  ORF type:complete len:419 (+),score=93.70 TRINITY_DN8615_c0_g1_i1:142-1398(+)